MITKRDNSPESKPKIKRDQVAPLDKLPLRGSLDEPEAESLPQEEQKKMNPNLLKPVTFSKDLSNFLPVNAGSKGSLQDENNLLRQAILRSSLENKLNEEKSPRLKQKTSKEDEDFNVVGELMRKSHTNLQDSLDTENVYQRMLKLEESDCESV